MHSYKILTLDKIDLQFQLPGIKSTHFWHAAGGIITTSKLSPSASAESAVDRVDEIDVPQPSSLVSVGTWVIVDYNGNHYPGLVTEKRHNEVQVKCMEHYGSGHYKFPTKTDEIWYQPDKIIRSIPAPNMVGSRGIYSL